MGITFGMPSLIELNSIEENINLCHQLGLNFVEINMNMLYCLPEKSNVDSIIRLLRQYNIKLSMHFPEEIEFATYYPEIKAANIALFRRFVLYGEKLGVEKINIHLNPGASITLPERKAYSYEKYPDVYLSSFKSSLQEMIPFANSHNIKTCIENVTVPKFLENVLLMLGKEKDVYFTYDIGHDAKSKYNVEDIYKQLGEKVVHMHLHDYDNKTDHQILFKGIINLYEKLQFAKNNNMTAVIEVKSAEALRESVMQLMMRKFI